MNDRPLSERVQRYSSDGFPMHDGRFVNYEDFAALKTKCERHLLSAQNTAAQRDKAWRVRDSLIEQLETATDKIAALEAKNKRLLYYIRHRTRCSCGSEDESRCLRCRLLEGGDGE